MKKTWRADFFADPDDTSPSRSVIISADSEDEAVDKAAAQIGDAVRVEFTHVISGEIKDLRDYETSRSS
jgi:hypothetical protein